MNVCENNHLVSHAAHSKAQTTTKQYNFGGRVGVGGVLAISYSCQTNLMDNEKYLPLEYR